MKWFKHDSDASNDAKLKKLRLKYGAQGYGIYWYCLELIARNVEKHNLTFELEHDAELIADDFKLSSDLVQHIMNYMVELELFENINGIVSCLKMANRTDEYTQKLLQSIKKTTDSVGIVSGETPTKSVLIEENRREENITEKKEKTNKGSRLSKDWVIPDEYVEFCNKERPDLSAHYTAEQFKDYWIGVAGSKGVKTDWFATWRNWVRSQRTQSLGNKQKQREDDMNWFLGNQPSIEKDVTHD
jgi:hypothetical protein